MRTRVTSLFLLAVALALAALSTAALADEADDPRFRPLPGREVVKPIAPDWCANVNEQVSSSGPEGAAASVHARAGGSDLGTRDLQNIGRLACGAPDSPVLQAAVAHARQRWINLVGGTEADHRAALRLRLASDFDAQKEAWCQSLKVSEEASIEDKALSAAMAEGTGCRGVAREIRFDPYEPTGFWLDARAEVPSEILRATYVVRCLSGNMDKEWPDASTARVQAHFGVCGVDGRRLDRARLDQELADPKFNDFARIHARETFTYAQALTNHIGEKVKAMGAKDEAMKKLLLEAPEQGFASWEKSYAANKDALEAARAYEKKFFGPSRKALLGCGDALRKNFHAYVKSKAPKTAEEAKKVALDEVGSQLLEALALCDANEGRHQIAFTLALLLERKSDGGAPLRRGPRVAAYNAMLAVLSDILADRDKFPLRDLWLPFQIPPNETMRDGVAKANMSKLGWGQDAQGTIATVKKNGELVNVTFKPVTTYILNRTCRPNKRILRIDGGNIVYDSDCTIGNPPKLPVTTKQDPVDVPALVGDGLKPGQVATFGVNNRNMPKLDAMPKEVWDAALKKLIVWHGITL